MKKYSQSLAACLFLLLLLSTHFVYGFKNPYWNTNGSVFKIKELQDNTLLVIFQNGSSGYTELSHLSANGDLMASTVLFKTNQYFYVGTMYEYNGNFAVSMVYTERDSINTIRYLEFRFYDTSLNLLSALKHIVDGQETNRYTNDHINNNLTYVGVVKHQDAGYALKATQYGLNGVKKKESSDILLPYDSISFFMKAFQRKAGTTVFALNRTVLNRFDFDSSLNLIGRDSFSNSFSTEGSGKLYKYSLVSDMISINDSQFVGIFGDTAEGDKSEYVTYLGKVENNMILSYAKMESISSFLSYLVGAIYRLNSLKFNDDKKEVYVIPQQINLDGSSLGSVVFKYSNNLDSLDGLKFRCLPDIDTLKSILTFDILQSRNYIIGGTTNLGNGFIGIIDTTGLVSGLRNIDKQREIHLFPNPGKNIVYGIPEHTTLRLIDISGRQLNIDQDKNGADISTLNTGIYFYQIIDEQGSIVAKGKYLKE